MRRQFDGAERCPAAYSTSGAVLQGPAAQSLQSFATRFAGNVLTITVA